MQYLDDLNKHTLPANYMILAEIKYLGPRSLYTPASTNNIVHNLLGLITVVPHNVAGIDGAVKGHCAEL